MKHLIKPLGTALSGAVLTQSAIGVAVISEPRAWMLCVLGFIASGMYLYAKCEEAGE